MQGAQSWLIKSQLFQTIVMINYQISASIWRDGRIKVATVQSAGDSLKGQLIDRLVLHKVSRIKTESKSMQTDFMSV